MAPTILVVDDEPDLELLIKQKFRKEIKENIYDFIFANNGLEALRFLSENVKIELVLTDINMPEMDGLTLLKKMQELNNPLLRSVIVSAYGDILNIRTAMNGGAFDFVVKPIDLKDLEITIQKALRNLETLKQALSARDELMIAQKELRDARALQLSMLPKEIPQLPNLEIAVYMKTATEVGGDYYDFSQKEDGSINIAIGDATGHGTKAGTMVSIMKALFTSDSSKLGIREFFNSSNKTIKEINLERIMMAFSMLNIKGNKVTYLNAAMPSIYFHNKSLQKIEEIDSHNMPLGAMSFSNFKKEEFEVHTGDLILMMSDGFPELMNDEKEMFGYKRVRNLIEKISKYSAEEIITKLKNVGEKWINNIDPDDDVTFVVIKVK